MTDPTAFKLSDTFDSLIFKMHLYGLHLIDNIDDVTKKVVESDLLKDVTDTMCPVAGIDTPLGPRPEDAVRRRGSSLATQTSERKSVANPNPEPRMSKMRLTKLCFRIYGFIMVCVLWLSVVQTMLSFRLDGGEEGGILILRITYLVWTLQCAAYGSVLYRMSFSGWLTTLLSELNALYLLASSLVVCDKKMLSHLKIQFRRRTFTYVMMQFICSAFLYISKFIMPDIPLLMNKVALPFGPERGNIYLCLLVLCLEGTVCLLSYELLSDVTVVVTHLLHQLSSRISFHNDENDILPRLTTYHRLYLHLSRITNFADSYLKVISAISVIANCVITVFVIYTIIVKYNLEVSFKIFITVWFVVHILGFLVVAVRCSSLHSKVIH